MVSYADLVTLLFACFTMLYAVSTVDARKLQSMLQAFHRAFDPGPAESDTLHPGAKVRPPSIVPAAPLATPASADNGDGGIAEVENRLRESLAQALNDQRVAISPDRRGLVISIREGGAFPTGKADMSTAASDIVGEIARVLKGSNASVRVEGHTDNVPIHTPQYPSNWELSTARAVSVVAYLINQAQLDPGRLSAAGYAEFHPRLSNDTDRNRSFNRRVDIVVLRASTARAEEPPPSEPKPAR
jgi:chemotaxis protein MotB